MSLNSKSSIVKGRRQFVREASILLAGLTLTSRARLKTLFVNNVAASKHTYLVGVSDLMIYKRQKIGAFKLTSEIGAQGVEVDMGGLGDRPSFASQLADASVCKAYLEEAKAYGLKICSVAMTGFYAQSFATRATWQTMISDSLKTADRLGVKHLFLPLGINSDLRRNPELRPALVKRLKVAGHMAQEMGKVIGIETSLNAKAERAFLEEIGSGGIKSYFNFANAVEHGLDISEELKVLGKENICQIHCTNSDGVHLSKDPKVDLPGIKKTLDEMGWTGWLVLLRSRDQTNPKDVLYNFGSNTKYVRSVFQG